MIAPILPVIPQVAPSDGANTAAPLSGGSAETPSSSFASVLNQSASAASAQDKAPTTNGNKPTRSASADTKAAKTDKAGKPEGKGKAAKSDGTGKAEDKAKADDSAETDDTGKQNDTGTPQAAPIEVLAGIAVVTTTVTAQSAAPAEPSEADGSAPSTPGTAVVAARNDAPAPALMPGWEVRAANATAGAGGSSPGAAPPEVSTETPQPPQPNTATNDTVKQVDATPTKVGEPNSQTATQPSPVLASTQAPDARTGQPLDALNASLMLPDPPQTPAPAATNAADADQTAQASAAAAPEAVVDPAVVRSVNGRGTQGVHTDSKTADAPKSNAQDTAAAAPAGTAEVIDHQATTVSGYSREQAGEAQAVLAQAKPARTVLAQPAAQADANPVVQGNGPAAQAAAAVTQASATATAVASHPAEFVSAITSQPTDISLQAGRNAATERSTTTSPELNAENGSVAIRSASEEERDAGPQERSTSSDAGQNPSFASLVSGKPDATSSAQNVKFEVAQQPDRTQVVQQVAQKIETMHATSGRQQMTMQLQPDHLGQIRLTVTSSGHDVSARIVTETTAARQALDDGREQLRNSLEQRGLNLQGLDVALNQNSSARQFMTFGQEPNRSASTTASTNQAAAVASTAEAAPRAEYRVDGRLDYQA